MKELTVLANPGHGNGPAVSLLLAAEAIRRQSGLAVNLVFPYSPDSDQLKIIQERRGRALRIYFDAKLAELLSKVTLKHNDFKQNVLEIVNHHESVQALARRHVKRGLRDLIELREDGAQTETAKVFSEDDLDLELNHGSRIRILDSVRAFCFFPCLLSDLLERSPPMGLSRAVLERALERIKATEQGFARIFMPYIHSLSWDANWRPPKHARVDFTPFPRPRARTDFATETKPSGIYLMPSGVGSLGNPAMIEAAHRLIAEAKKESGEDLAVYVPYPDVRFQNAFPKAQILGARVIPSSNIRFIVGRAGWGTLWECLNASKIFIAIPAIAGDDPEIEFNLKTLETKNIAICWQPGKANWPEIPAVAQNIQNLIERLEETDGLKVMARAIGQMTGLWS